MKRIFVLLFLTCTCIGGAIWISSPDPSHAVSSESVTESAGIQNARVSADQQVIAESAPLPTADALRSQIDLPQIPLVNVTKQSGLQFTHDRGFSGEYLMPETFGSGCAVLDLNDDDLFDVVFINSRTGEWQQDGDGAGEISRSTLSAWLNEGDLTFRDVTHNVGLDISIYGMGVAVGDYDADGDPDLYVTCVGGNVLLRNDAGRFVDVTAESGTGGGNQSWSTSGGWLDFDGDGDLDLFVANYIAWTPELENVVDAITFKMDERYGSPTAYPGTVPFLFRNDGAGNFTDVAADVGLTEPTKSLGVAFADFNNDQRIDVFVANDTDPDQLWLNLEGRFTDVGSSSGVAFSSTGAARAGMGVDIADFRNSGKPAIAVGQFENEMTALFTTVDGAMFVDEALPAGLGADSLPDLTWGVRFADFDLDGRLDLLTVNGHVEQNDSHMFRPGNYRQSPKLYWNSGPDTAREFIPLSSHECGDEFHAPISGRSLAVADFDLDGDIDFIAAGSGQTAQVFRNDLDMTDRRWLRVRLVGTPPNRDAIGASIKVTSVSQSSNVTQSRLVSAARGYLSSGTLVQTFGLPADSTVAFATVTWPDGSDQQVSITYTNQTYTIQQQSEEKLK